ncbi:MAG: hypothetical protein CSB55_08705 [Candidatus Cloacimonadota bacterium]|nr:MAG: hypothetical protein CSB55_08705 [Candidatus Cloacimonadota bacterium]
MQVKAVKTDDGILIPQFKNFDDIKNNVVEVDINLSRNEARSLDYKELRGDIVLERFQEKDKRRIAYCSSDYESYLLKNEKIKSFRELLLAVHKGDF